MGRVFYRFEVYRFGPGIGVENVAKRFSPNDNKNTTIDVADDVLKNSIQFRYGVGPRDPKSVAVVVDTCRSEIHRKPFGHNPTSFRVFKRRCFALNRCDRRNESILVSLSPSKQVRQVRVMDNILNKRFSDQTVRCVRNVKNVCNNSFSIFPSVINSARKNNWEKMNFRQLQR